MCILVQHAPLFPLLSIYVHNLYCIKELESNSLIALWHFDPSNTIQYNTMHILLFLLVMKCTVSIWNKASSSTQSKLDPSKCHNLELSFHLLKVLNDAYTALTQFLLAVQHSFKITASRFVHIRN